MMVRCGACRSSFDVPGPGRHACPACGATNQVGAAAAPPGPAGGGFGAPGGGFVAPGGGPAAPPPPPVEITRVECSACSFRFIVGEVEVAVCPNCGAEVETAEAGSTE